MRERMASLWRAGVAVDCRFAQQIPCLLGFVSIREWNTVMLVAHLLQRACSRKRALYFFSIVRAKLGSLDYFVLLSLGEKGTLQG